MWQKRFAAFLKFILLLLVMLLGALYLIQDRLLHYPEPIDRTKALLVTKELRLTPWPDAAAPLGWLRETPATTRGTIVLFHGNAGHALHRNWFADEMETRGYRTLLAEYPGYGHRSGAVDETTLSTDAAVVISAIRQRFGGLLIVAGESVGAGVASAALAHGNSGVNGVSAVMLITPWNDLGSVASHHYPLLPTRLVLRDRYDSVANLRGFTGPKFVLIAGRDSIIPAELGHRLFDRLDANKKLLVLPNSDHNNWTDEMRPEMWQAALTFLEGR